MDLAFENKTSTNRKSLPFRRAALKGSDFLALKGSPERFMNDFQIIL